jgi:hypothetical protein
LTPADDPSGAFQARSRRSDARKRPFSFVETVFSSIEVLGLLNELLPELGGKRSATVHVWHDDGAKLVADQSSDCTTHGHS